MSSADLVETLIKCQNTTSYFSLCQAHTHLNDSESTHFLNLFHAFCFVFLFFAFHAPCLIFFFFFTSLFSLTKYTNIHRHARKIKKKKSLFCYSFTCRRSCTPPHTGFPLISFFFIEKGKDIAREKEREEKEKWSYRFELHTVSILPSLNDLNKEFNTAGSE